MRIPATWREPLQEGRLLVLSPFSEKQNQTTAELAEQRNRFVAEVAAKVLFAHASEAGKSERLLNEQIDAGKDVFVVDVRANKRLVEKGAKPIRAENVHRVFRWACG